MRVVGLTNGKSPMRKCIGIKIVSGAALTLVAADVLAGTSAFPVNSAGPAVLRASCVQAVMRNAFSAKPDAQPGVRRDVRVDRVEAIKVSPTQVACVVSGRRVEEKQATQTSVDRAWMFMLSLSSSKEISVDVSSPWSEIPLRPSIADGQL